VLNTASKPLEILQNATVLFQGDSITDCGRNYKTSDSLGQGYVMMISSWYSAKYPEKNVRFINRGRKGDRVKDLKSRWQKDCLELKPNVVSILIGINDVLGKYMWNRPTTIESFETDYRYLLEQVRDEIHASPIIIQPFLLAVAERYADLRKELITQIKVVDELSKEFDAILIPLDTIFCEASMKKTAPFWANDGIHPTLPGHALIAQSWLRIVVDDLP
jgi:lysophospholipase L1-like esterase